jgi:putative CocE/NonD family hydrolase
MGDRAARRGLVLLLGVAAAFMGLVVVPARAEAAPGPVTTWGYVRMADGVRLRWTLLRPSDRGRYPVAVNYAPYMAGSDPVAESLNTARLLAAGYAVLGVNTRGSGCSGGTLDLFTEQHAEDGARTVDWAAEQPWSTGKVGMFGLSAPGIYQYGVAAKAKHLAAIAPFSPAIDIYRDAGYPGGVPEIGYAAAWAYGLQPRTSVQAGAAGVAQGDLACAAPNAMHGVDLGRTRLVGELYSHQWDDGSYTQRDPQRYLHDVHMPVLACLAWQDDAVGSRSLYQLNELNAATTWSVLMNGYHGACDADVVSSYLVRFFDHFLKGRSNGYERSPHVTVLHDAHADAAEGLEIAAGTSYAAHPAWTTSFVSWPVPVEPWAVSLRSGGRLDVAPARQGEPADAYLSPLPSSLNEDGYTGQSNLGWKVPDVPGGSLSYTTSALARDLEVFGPSSVDLWLASTGPDTDLQVTLSEVRPDGQEVYVQRGWLRASHRRLDPARTTALRPFQTHQAADARPLFAGLPTKVRIEVNPVDYVFRAGSHLRLTIDTPLSSGLWVFAPNLTPVVNRVLHDPAHPSMLVLGRLPGGRARVAAQPCDTLINQPCRPNLTPVPPGRLAVPTDG